MRPEECAEVLLDELVSLEDKADAIGTYLEHYTVWGKEVGMGARNGRAYGMKRLFEVARELDWNADKNLHHIVGQLAKLAKKKRQAWNEEKRTIAKNLRGIAPGTPIVIRDRGRERSAKFIEVKRTRFLCEYPDGKRYSVPVQLFVRAEKQELVS